MPLSKRSETIVLEDDYLCATLAGSVSHP